MDTTRRFDAEPLSRLITVRLRETHRSHEAAAFQRQRFLRVLVDAMFDSIEFVNIVLPGIRTALRAGHGHKTLLATTSNDQQTLVLDLDEMVNKIGRLALELQERQHYLNDSCRNDHPQWPGSSEELIAFCADESAAPARKVPLQGSLADLKPVSGLSDAYLNPDFSKSRLRPKSFLR